jgi:hypothetical protein
MTNNHKPGVSGFGALLILAMCIAAFLWLLS